MNIQQEIKDNIEYYKNNLPEGEDNIKVKLSVLHMRCTSDIFNKLIEEIEEELGEHIDHSTENFVIAVDGITVRVHSNYLTLQFIPYYVPSKN